MIFIIINTNFRKVNNLNSEKLFVFVQIVVKQTVEYINIPIYLYIVYKII
jgi:hypothetical protein